MNSFMLTPEILAAITILGQDIGDRIPGAEEGGYSQLSGFATIMMPYSSAPALVTKSLGYFWKVRTVSPPCHAQHTEINLICFPLSQTALQPVWGKAFLTVKLAGTRPAGLKQRKETKKLCLWNSVPQCSPARGFPQVSDAFLQ